MILQYIAAAKKCKETSRFDGMRSQFQNFSKLVLGLILHNYFAKKTANKVLALIALSAATDLVVSVSFAEVVLQCGRVLGESRFGILVTVEAILPGINRRQHMRRRHGAGVSPNDGKICKSWL